MIINLKLFGTLRNLAKHEQEVSLSEDSKVSDLIDSLVREYGAEFGGRISRQEMWQIGINGHLQSLSAAMETELKDGDEVAILPLQFGG